VRAEEPVHGRRPAEPFCLLASQPPSLGGVAPQQPLDRVGARRVVVLGGQAGLADDLGQSALRAHHHRRAAGKRLERGQAERLGRAGSYDHVRGREQPRQRSAVGHVAEERDRQPGRPGLQRPAPSSARAVRSPPEAGAT
jgi:hypothetical protein